jgi:hypothetical protein
VLNIDSLKVHILYRLIGIECLKKFARYFAVPTVILGRIFGSKLRRRTVLGVHLCASLSLSDLPTSTGLCIRSILSGLFLTSLGGSKIKLSLPLGDCRVHPSTSVIIGSVSCRLIGSSLIQYCLLSARSGLLACLLSLGMSRCSLRQNVRLPLCLISRFLRCLSLLCLYTYLRTLVRRVARNCLCLSIADQTQADDRYN